MVQSNARTSSAPLGAGVRYGDSIDVSTGFNESEYFLG
jgi:hypothetical protein